MNIRSRLKRKYGDKLCLIGNLDVGDVLTMGTVADVRKQVQFNIENVGYDGGYCVGSGNSIPDYVKLENFQAMLETVKEANNS